MRKTSLFLSLILTCLSVTASSADEKNAAATILPFGEAGKFKMLYDARQRPQSIFLREAGHRIDATCTREDE